MTPHVPPTRKRQQKKHRPKSRPNPWAAKYVELESRLMELEGRQREAADFRRACAQLREAQKATAAAQREYEAASDKFFGAYLQTMTVTYLNPTDSTGSAGRFNVRHVWTPVSDTAHD